MLQALAQSSAVFTPCNCAERRSSDGVSNLGMLPIVSNWKPERWEGDMHPLISLWGTASPPPCLL